MCCSSSSDTHTIDILANAFEQQKKRDAKYWDKPIDGPYKALARTVRILMGWHEPNRPFLTSREASVKTKVNYSTITTMARGYRPSEATLLKFAKGFNADIYRLFKIVGYDPWMLIPKEKD